MIDPACVAANSLTSTALTEQVKERHRRDVELEISAPDEAGSEERELLAGD